MIVALQQSCKHRCITKDTFAWFRLESGLGKCANLCNLLTGRPVQEEERGKSAELCREQLLHLEEELQLLQLLREYTNQREGGAAGLITMTFKIRITTKCQNCVNC